MAFQCRIAVSPFTNEEEALFFELLTKELNDLRSGSAQQKFFHKHTGDDTLNA